MAAQDTQPRCASIPPVQNVHAMRPDVRADYERALAGSGATPRSRAARALLHRAARPARRPLRRRPALRGRVGRAARRDRRAAAAREPELRRLDHEREITPDWLQREQARRLRRLRRPLRRHARRRPRAPALPARARRHLPAPDAAAAARGPSPTTAATRSSTTARSSPRSGTMDGPRARSPRSCARRGMALCVDVVLNHTAREHALGAGRDRRRRGQARLLPHVRRPHAPDAYERTLPEVFPDTAPGNFTWDPALGALGVDDVQRLPVGPRLREPGGVPRDGRGDARPRATPASTCCGSTPCRSCGSARARARQNQPEVHELLQAFRAADADRRPGRGLQGGGDRLAARPRRLPRRRPPRGQGVRPRLPQRAHGAAVEHARVGPRRAADAHAREHAAGAAGRRLGDLRPLPRRHRLGGDRGGRGARSARTATCTGASWPTSTRATSPARSRAARASRPSRDGRGAHERHDGVARRPRGGARARRRARAGARACAASCSLHAVAFAHGGLPLIYMGDELGLRNDHASATTPPTRRQPLAAPARRWTGRPRSAAPTPRPSRAACGRACARSPPRAAAAAPRTARAASRPCGPATTTSSGSRREHAGDRLLLLGQLQRRAAAGPRRASPASTASDIAQEPRFLTLGAYEFAWLRN